jgi:L-ascorbate metabolism protein UlaG (beta-lactamase superfamily)
MSHCVRVLRKLTSFCLWAILVHTIGCPIHFNTPLLRLGLFCSMRLIGEEGIDLAVLPIGDNFTMGPDDALRAVKLIEPWAVIPIHYNTFDVIAQDPHAWAERVQAETSAEPVVLKPGGSYTL